VTQRVKRKRKEKNKEKRRKKNKAKIAMCVDPATLDAQFATIVIDPPWDWGDT
jgi:hypothetical protein